MRRGDVFANDRDFVFAHPRAIQRGLGEIGLRDDTDAAAINIDDRHRQRHQRALKDDLYGWRTPSGKARLGLEPLHGAHHFCRDRGRDMRTSQFAPSPSFNVNISVENATMTLSNRRICASLAARSRAYCWSAAGVR